MTILILILLLIQILIQILIRHDTDRYDAETRTPKYNGCMATSISKSISIAYADARNTNIKRGTG